MANADDPFLDDARTLIHLVHELDLKSAKRAGDSRRVGEEVIADFLRHKYDARPASGGDRKSREHGRPGGPRS